MNRADNYSLLLLAGGKSSRMGSNKAELLYEGRTFVENLIIKAEKLGIKQIYLSGYQEKREDVQVVWDIYPGIGPLGGIHAGMKSMTTPFCLILPVDVPQIPVEFLNDLLEHHEHMLKNSEVKELPLVLEHQEFLEPLIGIYPVSIAEFIEERIRAQRLSVFRMLKELGCKGFRGDILEWQIANINTREDYEKLLNQGK